MLRIEKKLRDHRRHKGDKKIRAIFTSYEMVWAIARKAPRRAYFELEDQPAIRVVYTFRLEIHRNNKPAHLIKVDIEYEG